MSSTLSSILLRRRAWPRWPVAPPRSRPKTPTTVPALLDERRANLAAQRTRLVNQLHALLRDLIPGGADTDLTAAGATQALATVRPAGPVEAARKQLARDQVRMRHSTGHANYDRKVIEGKTHNEAMRCLKQRLADHVWRIMIADERRQAAAPGGHSGATLTSSAAGLTPTPSSSDRSLPEAAGAQPTTSDPAA
jgi:hypothetical protein